jgi:hypothetical protein
MLQAGDPLPGKVSEGAGSEAERLAAFDEAVAAIATRVESASRQAEDWQEQTRTGLVELLRFCDEWPDTARELVIDSIAWGPAVLERRAALLDALAEAIDRGRAEADPAGPELQPAAPALGSPGATTVTSSASSSAAPAAGTAENLVGACLSLLHTRLLQATAGPFVELAPSLMSMIAQPYLGAQAARRELGRPLAYAEAVVEREPGASAAGVREASY